MLNDCIVIIVIVIVNDCTVMSTKIKLHCSEINVICNDSVVLYIVLM